MSLYANGLWLSILHYLLYNFEVVSAVQVIKGESFLKTVSVCFALLMWEWFDWLIGDSRRDYANCWEIVVCQLKLEVWGIRVVVQRVLEFM